MFIFGLHITYIYVLSEQINLETEVIGKHLKFMVVAFYSRGVYNSDRHFESKTP